MQAIEVKYLGPTNHQGSRLKATCQSGSVTVGWKYELEDNDNYLRAAIELVRKMGWYDIDMSEHNLTGGVLASGSHVFVFNPLKWSDEFQPKTRGELSVLGEII